MPVEPGPGMKISLLKCRVYFLFLTGSCLKTFPMAPSPLFVFSLFSLAPSSASTGGPSQHRAFVPSHCHTKPVQDPSQGTPLSSQPLPRCPARGPCALTHKLGATPLIFYVCVSNCNGKELRSLSFFEVTLVNNFQAYDMIFPYLYAQSLDL